MYAHLYRHAAFLYCCKHTSIYDVQELLLPRVRLEAAHSSILRTRFMDPLMCGTAIHNTCTAKNKIHLSSLVCGQQGSQKRLESE